MDERKAAAEVERRKASEAAARMEQQVGGSCWAAYLQSCHCLACPMTNALYDPTVLRGVSSQVLELQSRLEAAQHRERAVQAEAERLRCAGQVLETSLKRAWDAECVPCCMLDGQKQLPTAIVPCCRSHVPCALMPLLRAATSKRDAGARQLSATLSQLEVAEAALRDPQGTASRLLQVKPGKG